MDGKIRSDIKTICSESERIDAIYYFAEQDIPVARRHSIRDWASEAFEVHVEIFDGQAISEALADPDTFWIAEEFLSVSADQYPQPAESGTRYTRLREHWLRASNAPRNYADFFEIKYGLRHATFNKAHIPDLSQWIRLIQTFATADVSLQLQRKAIYEVAVASLRGQNNLDKYSTEIDIYLASIATLQDAADLTDATTLLSYCSSARCLGHSVRSPEKLHEWSKTLVRRLKSLLATTSLPGRRCLMLQLLGNASRLQFLHGVEPRLETEDMFRYWDLMTKEVEKALLFPLEQFADLLTVLTPHVGGEPQFMKLTRKVDELLESRTGAFVAAEKCRDRAVAYMDAEQFIPAIKQLHATRVKWFTAETLKGSILAMLTLADCYSRLGLQYAAAYYALGAVIVAFRSDSEALKPLLSRATFVAADHFYRAGASITYLQLLTLAFYAHNTYARNPGDLDQHGVLQRATGHGMILRALARRFNSEIARFVDLSMEEWPIDPEYKSELKAISEEATLSYYTEDEATLVRHIQDDLTDFPFADLGGTRRICWSALGLYWVVSHDNTYDETLIAEEFVATCQIIAADLAAVDLGILPTSVEIEIALNEGDDFLIDEKLDNEKTVWIVSFPRNWLAARDHAAELHDRVAAVATAVLHGCSVLKSSQFMEIMKKAYKEGLSSKTFSVRPYAELYSETLPKTMFKSLNRHEVRPPWYGQRLEYAVPSEISWMQSPGPGYTKAKALRFIGNRYKNAIRPIRLALTKLLEHEEFRTMIQKLRAQGYRDWFILVLLNNVILNYRVEKRVQGGAGLDELKKAMNDEMRREESADSAVPPTEFFEEIRIDFQKQITWLAIAKTWDLQAPRQTPDFKAFERLLSERYRCLEDDIEHEDPFPGV